MALGGDIGEQTMRTGACRMKKVWVVNKLPIHKTFCETRHSAEANEQNLYNQRLGIGNQLRGGYCALDKPNVNEVLTFGFTIYIHFVPHLAQSLAIGWRGA